MLGQRTPQTSIFEGDQLYLEHVGARTFYSHLARHRHELFRDEDFAALYSPNWGRPSVPPSLLCIALLLQTYEGCSDAEARDRAAFDLRWKVALGVPGQEKPFTKSTLQLFRAQLLVHNKLRLPFERSLELARRTGYLKSDRKLRAAVDTSNILGRGAVKDTYNLIADGIVSVMRRLAKGSGKSLERWAADHDLSPYTGSSIKGEAAIDWSDDQAREGLLEGLVADAECVLELARRARAGVAPGSPAAQRLVKAAEVLSQVLLQDVEQTGAAEGRATKLRRGTSAERICSIHDPEMRHGRKSASTRFDGHKVAVAADVDSQLVTAVDVLPGSAKDDVGSLELVQQAQAATGLEVEGVLGDCAYGSAANRERFADAGIPLLAKMAARSNGEFFSKDEFTIDLETMSCRCPAGVVTQDLISAGWYATFDGSRVRAHAFRFPAKVCSACPLRAPCYKPGAAGRRVHLHPREQLLQAARAWQRSPAFADFRQQRQVVEHRIARLVQLGIRQARYFGRGKTLFQVLMAATVANLTLIASKTGGCHPAPGSSAPQNLIGSVVASLSAVSRGLWLLSTTPFRRLGHLAVPSLKRCDVVHTPFKMAAFRPGL